MKPIQKLQLDILVKLDEVCHKHNLRYYLAYGTCIGAIRHKGFIPWDHDIDVLMPIEDAKKLCEYQVDFGAQYFVQSYRTDPSFGSINMRVIDKLHDCYIKEEGKEPKQEAVFLDIYPFYFCPKNKVHLTLNVLRSHVLKMLVGGVPENHGGIAKLISKCILLYYKFQDREKAIRRYENKINFKGESLEIADYYGLDVTMFGAITYRKEWFAEPSKLEFEGYLFDGPTDPDKYLTKRYGDYMTPPPIEKQKEEVTLELVK